MAKKAVAKKAKPAVKKAALKKLVKKVAKKEAVAAAPKKSAVKKAALKKAVRKAVRQTIKELKSTAKAVKKAVRAEVKAARKKPAVKKVAPPAPVAPPPAPVAPPAQSSVGSGTGPEGNGSASAGSASSGGAAGAVSTPPPVIPRGPTIGTPAPDFRLPATTDSYLSLGQFLGRKNVVLYFYPRDNTPGCTTQACDFRDSMGALNMADTVVLGISTDSIASHKGFADKFNLPFPLLADEQHEVAQKYGAWVEKSMYGKTYWGIERSTFLIDKQGKIAAKWNRVQVPGHVAAVRQAVAALPV